MSAITTADFRPSLMCGPPNDVMTAECVIRGRTDYPAINLCTNSAAVPAPYLRISRAR
jgi:hypothetical protein